jgi:hypothetical protein
MADLISAGGRLGGTLGFEKTIKQKEATELLSSDARYCMLYGGS